MIEVSRRSILAGIALVVSSRARSASVAETFNVDSHEGKVVLTRYAANRSGKRPSVFLLHGLRGFTLKPRAYERYAVALAAEGIDAYLLHYYTEADSETLEKLGAKERREAYEAGRYGAWAERVSSTLTAILAKGDSSDRIGLLGFSLGGFVAAAAAAAARDDRIAALAVIYGGMPERLASEVKRLPPLIELHGDADRNVPLQAGEALVTLARAVGAPAEQVKYAGKGHGFDFTDNDPATNDAVERVSRFFQDHLNST